MVPAPLLPLAADGISLCHANESRLFSCSIGAKAVAVCASPDVLRGSGYLAYRFGHFDTRPEMEYSPRGSGAMSAFKFRSAGSAEYGVQLLQFSVGDFTYLVFSDHHDRKRGESGVAVNGKDQRIAYLPCNETSLVNNLDRLRNLGLPAGDFISYTPRE
jgi:hypothetical protein